MAFDRATLDTLMDGRVEHDNWMAFDETLRDAAVVQAQSMLAVELGEALTEDASAVTDLIRHDLATVLQAYHLLRFSKALADGTKSGPKHLANDAEGRKGKKDAPPPPMYSPDALMYLYGRPGASSVADATGLLKLPYKFTMIRG